ncbi:TylF/MycF/NovP-related O-methyltransferase [Actinomadura parmotrematis]|uniref:TylF/MycF family methyltransferase n=1 Tax=Actinomadura parmotrematis TaxID=2864039 RepID=A0ABS7FWE6_9ACTN|nr:TylF/MycF/NovP-related O-methyltransferase [Actinomadura parmotrematis]MBW8484305.1 TylF/MycF family methyltransferase [Actinomadura parmotrematis]
MTAPPDPGARLYLDLLKRCLLGLLQEDPPIPTPWRPGDRFDAAARRAGADWPSRAHTMVGLARLDHLEALVGRILADGVPGDLLEAGVARGGTTIFLRGLLKAHGRTDRTVWAADSFRGFPRPGEPGGDSPLAGRIAGALAGAAADSAYARFLRGTSLAEVRHAFDTYGLLDERVRFLPGWFGDTLPAAPVDRLALLRLDADLYGSTRDALAALYPKVAAGGYVVVDDYLVIDECRAAVHDHLDAAGETADLEEIDHSAVFWRKAPR